MKKLAILMVLVLVLSVSCVFATEANEDILIAPNPVLSGEELSGEDTPDILIAPADEISGEENVVSGEPTEEDIDEPADIVEPVEDDIESGEANDVEPADEAEVPTSNNSATVGAIIAIVIVVAVVAIAAILRKD